MLIWKSHISSSSAYKMLNVDKLLQFIYMLGLLHILAHEEHTGPSRWFPSGWYSWLEDVVETVLHPQSPVPHCWLMQNSRCCLLRVLCFYAIQKLIQFRLSKFKQGLSTHCSLQSHQLAINLIITPGSHTRYSMYLDLCLLHGSHRPNSGKQGW